MLLFRTTQSERKRGSILRRPMILHHHICPQVRRRITLSRKVKRSPSISLARAARLLPRHLHNLLEVLLVSPFFLPRPKPQVEDSYGLQTMMFSLEQLNSRENYIAVGPECPFAFLYSIKRAKPVAVRQAPSCPNRPCEAVPTSLYKTIQNILPSLAT